MIPILYEASETSFSTNGIGLLRDAITCTVTEERGSSYELTMEYPVSGIHYESLTVNRIILAKPNMVSELQPFRIYRVSKPIGGIVEVNAQHITYDLSGYPDTPFYAANIEQAFERIMDYAVVTIPFTISCLIEDYVDTDFTVDSPASVRSLMDKIQGQYGGEWVYDRFTASLVPDRGENRGVVIRYGKNLIDATQEELCEGMYSAVYPYFKNDQYYIEATDRIVPVEGVTGVTNILTLDMSKDFENVPSSSTLQQAAEDYIVKNELDKPTVSLSISFSDLGDELVDIGDTITVYFEKLGIETTAKCYSLTYNVLAERIESCEVGDAKKTIADTIVGKVTASNGVYGGGGQETAQTFTTEISTSDWHGETTVTKTVQGLKVNAPHFVIAPNIDSWAIPEANTITFTVASIPSVNISVSILQMG